MPWTWLSSNPYFLGITQYFYYSFPPLNATAGQIRIWLRTWPGWDECVNNGFSPMAVDICSYVLMIAKHQTLSAMFVKAGMDEVHASRLSADVVVARLIWKEGYFVRFPFSSHLPLIVSIIPDGRFKLIREKRKRMEEQIFPTTFRYQFNRLAKLQHYLTSLLLGVLLLWEQLLSRQLTDYEETILMLWAIFSTVALWCLIWGTAQMLRYATREDQIPGMESEPLSDE
ncbi:hypothetical protein N431DRAFT_441912 [Stipitochalara longipes BDJ]|nr:hypothetical protein N431DRAFT_441912 [Stipitochalara longipes BDJ]